MRFNAKNHSARSLSSKAVRLAWTPINWKPRAVCWIRNRFGLSTLNRLSWAEHVERRTCSSRDAGAWDLMAPQVSLTAHEVLGDGSGQDLHALVYVSSASHLLSVQEIDHLLQRARMRNVRQAVTGVLLYSQGNFMQYLEGPAIGLERVYDKVKADALHHGIIKLLTQPIRSRLFEEWAMGFCPIGERLAGLGRIQYDARCAQRLTTPVGPTPAPATYWLVSKFWNNGHGQ